MRYLPYLFALVLAGLGYWVGVERTENQYAKQKARIQQDLFEVSEKLSEKTRQLEIYKHAQKDLVQELEEQARTNPGSDRPGIGPDGMRRLQKRWGVPGQ